MKLFNLIVLAAFVQVALVGVSERGHARWATPDDAEWSVEAMHYELNIKKDGTYKITTESLGQILREGARSMSNYRLNYNSVAAKFKVLEAETINGDQKFKVDREFIEDKPQASRINGFDQQNLVVVAFPKVVIGSKLRIKYVEERNEVPIPNQYSGRFDFGHNWLVKNYTIHIRSELPLNLEKHDPQDKLEVVQTKKSEDEYEITVKLRSPIYTRAIDEQWVSPSRKDLTWIVVSTAKKYSEIADALAAKYEEVLNAELPPSYKKILEAAKAKSSMVERLNVITSELATEVRYLGDWRPVSGGHVPRALEVVAKTKFGDCKDFAAGTAAILRKLGVKANVAWVERSIQPTPMPALAHAGAFNHAIVHAEAEGREWWIDPTNFASFAQGIFPDILDRPALVVMAGASRLGRIPAAVATDSVRENFSKVRLERNGDARIDASLNFKGRAASGYTGVLLKQSKDHIDHTIITAMADENRLKWHEISPYDLKSRITKDFTIKLRWSEANYSMRTTVGPAFYLDQQNLDHLIHLETKKRVSDMFLGHPDTTRYTDFLENVRMLGTAVPQCVLDTPWLRVSRKITQTARGLKIVDVREIKKSLVTIDELKGEVFQKFHRELTRCFDRVAVVYEPLLPTKPRTISSE